MAGKGLLRVQQRNDMSATVSCRGEIEDTGKGIDEKIKEKMF